MGFPRVELFIQPPRFALRDRTNAFVGLAFPDRIEEGGRKGRSGDHQNPFPAGEDDPSELRKQRQVFCSVYKASRRRKIMAVLLTCESVVACLLLLHKRCLVERVPRRGIVLVPKWNQACAEGGRGTIENWQHPTRVLQ